LEWELEDSQERTRRAQHKVADYSRADDSSKELAKLRAEFETERQLAVAAAEQRAEQQHRVDSLRAQWEEMKSIRQRKEKLYEQVRSKRICSLSEEFSLCDEFYRVLFWGENVLSPKNSFSVMNSKDFSSKEFSLFNEF